MPRVDALVHSLIHDSFRVRQVAGLFDVPWNERSELKFSVDLPDLKQPWTIGAIVGPSGSGKSTIARCAFNDGVIASDSIIDGFTWPADTATVDAFDKKLTGKDITGMLNAVGFSSPPAWLRPWQVLSNGEKFRCELARALLLDRPLVVFDEFTSVVDRQVARFGSAAVSKTIRQNRARCKRFVAVTCHYDILEWLQPDWWLDMASGKLNWRCLRRPPITLKIYRCPKDPWRIFKRHHYLSSNLNPVSRCYLATWNDQPIGFCAMIPLYGKKNWRIAHRLVVLPDYQGLGVGKQLLDFVAMHESKENTVSIVTSHPALIRSLSKNKKWRCSHIQKCGHPHPTVLKKTGVRIGSIGRTTASFRFNIDGSPPRVFKKRSTLHTPHS